MFFQVLTEELFAHSSEQDRLVGAEPVHRPMAAERKYYSPSSGNLIKRMPVAAESLSKGTSDEIKTPQHLSGSRVFKSADAYNRLLALKHAAKRDTVNTAIERPKESTTPNKHLTPKVSFTSCTTPDELRNSLPKPVKSNDSQSALETIPTKHITSIQVRKCTPRERNK